jgi:hypothetical protein
VGSRFGWQVAAPGGWIDYPYPYPLKYYPFP